MDRSVIFMQAVIKDSFDRYSTLIEDTEEAYRQAANEQFPTLRRNGVHAAGRKGRGNGMVRRGLLQIHKGSSQPFSKCITNGILFANGTLHIQNLHLPQEKGKLDHRC